MVSGGKVELAVAALRKGGMVAVYDSDDREGEADLVFHAKFASPEKIETLRKDAGGLICLATDSDVAARLSLPFFADFVCAKDSPVKGMKCKKTAYGDKPAFSVSVNHHGVYTGITDNDRALTIKKFCSIVENGCRRKRFLEEFYTPGHVFLLVGRGIRERKGHTEMSLELARKAGLSGAMVLCEMLGKGGAMAKQNVKKYCEKNGIVFLEGRDIYG